MKKSLVSLVIIMLLLGICVTSTAEIPLYDYSSFVGHWWQDAQVVGFVLEIYSVNGNEIEFWTGNGNPVNGHNIAYLDGNEAKGVLQENDGSSTHITMTFYDNRILLSFIYNYGTSESYRFDSWMASDTVTPRRIRKDFYESWAEEKVAYIEYYYENGMYYEAREELISLNSSGDRSVWSQTKIDEMNKNINYFIEVMEYVHSKLALIKSYLNQGLYYEARDELNWLKSGYILGPPEQRLWGEYELDAGLGVYKIENRNELQRKNLKEYMWTHFEKTPLRMQSNIHKDITTDWDFVNATQDLREYNFADVDNDGADELVITSKPIMFMDDDYRICFSIWDCRENGDVYCVLAKCGRDSRDVYKYSIISYGRENFLLEMAGVNRSVGYYKERNLYRISNGVVIPHDRMYSDYDIDYRDIGYINGERVSAEYAKQYIDRFDNSHTTLVSQ